MAAAEVAEVKPDFELGLDAELVTGINVAAAEEVAATAIAAVKL